MRGGDAKPRRAARLTTIAGHSWSARAGPARVSREAPSPSPSESEAFRLGHYLPAWVATYFATASICAFVRTFLKAGMTWPPFVTCF